MSQSSGMPPFPPGPPSGPPNGPPPGWGPPPGGPPSQPRRSKLPWIIGGVALLVALPLAGWGVVEALHLNGGDDDDVPMPCSAIAAYDGCGPTPPSESADPTESPDPTVTSGDDDQAAATAVAEGYVGALNERDESAAEEFACPGLPVDFASIPDGVTYEVVGVAVIGETAHATTKEIGSDPPTTYLMPLEMQDGQWCLAG